MLRVSVIGTRVAIISPESGVVVLVRTPALRRVKGENGFDERLVLGSQVRPLFLADFLVNKVTMRDFIMRDFKMERKERRGIRRALLDQDARR